MAKTNAERQKAWRKRKRSEQLLCTVWLSEANTLKMEKLVKQSGLSVQKAREKIINDLLENA